MATNIEEFIEKIRSLEKANLPLFAELLEEHYKRKLALCRTAWSFTRNEVLINSRVQVKVSGALEEQEALNRTIQHGSSMNVSLVSAIERVICGIVAHPDLASDSDYLDTIKKLDENLDEHLNAALVLDIQIFNKVRD